MQHTTVGDVSEILGVTAQQIHYAIRNSKVPRPMQAGVFMIFTQDDVENLRNYFAARPTGRGRPPRKKLTPA